MLLTVDDLAPGQEYVHREHKIRAKVASVVKNQAGEYVGAKGHIVGGASDGEEITFGHLENWHLPGAEPMSLDDVVANLSSRLEKLERRGAEKGEKGERGPAGPQGVKGDKGEKGDPGKDATK